jgi:hypothetical protein
MTYLSPPEYAAYGLDATTPQAIVGSASSLIDAHCRRATLFIAQYQERIRMLPDRNTIRLSYLPLAALDSAPSPMVSARGRYIVPRRGESALDDVRLNVALAFGLPGSWIDIDPASTDFDSRTGELNLPLNVIGLSFSEVEITYTAGYDVIPDAIKYACAQIVQNAAATPALNVKSTQVDRMRMDYFAPELLDASVRSLLAPFVAQKAG